MQQELAFHTGRDFQKRVRPAVHTNRELLKVLWQEATALSTAEGVLLQAITSSHIAFVPDGAGPPREGDGQCARPGQAAR